MTSPSSRRIGPGKSSPTFLKGVKAYMVEQACARRRLHLVRHVVRPDLRLRPGRLPAEPAGRFLYLHTGWGITPTTASSMTPESDSFVSGSTSEELQTAYSIIQDLVASKVIDPETWTQDDDTAMNSSTAARPPSSPPTVRSMLPRKRASLSSWAKATSSCTASLPRPAPTTTRLRTSALSAASASPPVPSTSWAKKSSSR